MARLTRLRSGCGPGLLGVRGQRLAGPGLWSQPSAPCAPTRGGADIDFTPDDETVAIVESWPHVLSGAAAAADWGWQPRFLLDDAVSDFVGRVRQIGDGAVRGDGRPEVAESR